MPTREGPALAPTASPLLLATAFGTAVAVLGVLAVARKRRPPPLGS